MYSYLVARIKGEEEYDWFTYDGKTINIPYRGVEMPLTKGQRFGVRKSSNKRDIRLVFEGEINRVFTITLDLAKKIARNIGE